MGDRIRWVFLACRLSRGPSNVRGDEQVLAVTGVVFDRLYEHRRRALLLGRDPA
jgi:hypothetical protein